MLIEQTVFASLESDRAHGYQLAGRSPGITDADVRELVLWGPSHDSLLSNKTPASTNFHRLGSGAFCISRTQPAGAEYSGRGGAAVYTQMLIVPPAGLARFANNPFTVLRAATARGTLAVHEQIPPILEPLRLVGHAAAVELSLVAQVAREPGAAAIGAFLQAALTHERLAVAWQGSIERLFAGLFNLLPVELRVEFSFSTGLKFSAGRATRLLSLPSDPAAWRSIERQGYRIINLDSLPADDIAVDGWPGYVADVLTAGKLSALAAEIARPRPGLTRTSLDAIGEQARASKNSFAPQENGHVGAVPTATAPTESPRDAVSSPANVLRADAPHAASALAVKTAELDGSLSDVERLAKLLSTQPPEVVELLERIDDLVFAAISGGEAALEELKVLWPTAAEQLDTAVLEESIAQYLRCALSICGRNADDNEDRPERALAVIDVLCVLFDH